MQTGTQTVIQLRNNATMPISKGFASTAKKAMNFVKRFIDAEKRNPFPHITIKFVEITPQFAREVLSKYNPNNRKVSEKHVRKLIKMILGDKWRGDNGDTIAFDHEGNLLNGQHRLTACDHADKNFWGLVIYGIDPSARATMDTGRNRTIANVIEMLGHPVYGKPMSEVSVSLYNLAVNDLYSKDKMDGFDVEKVFTDNPSIYADFMTVLSKFENSTVSKAIKKTISLPVITMIYHSVKTIDLALANQFVDVMINGGTGLSANHQFNQFRDMVGKGKGRRQKGFDPNRKDNLLVMGLHAFAKALENSEKELTWGVGRVTSNAKKSAKTAGFVHNPIPVSLRGKLNIVKV